VENAHAGWACGFGLDSRADLTTEKRADDLLDQHRLGVDAVEIAIIVIVAVVRIKTIAAAKVVRDLAVAISRAKSIGITLAIEELLGLSRGHAAIVFLGQSGRATTDAIADPVVGRIAILVAMAISVAVSRLRDCRPRDRQGRSSDE